MRLRGPKESIDMLNKLDPDNRLTLYSLRQLIKQGEIRVVHAGHNHLLDFDALLEYLHNPPAPDTDAQDMQKIHRIEAYRKR
jgi:predicted aldo/keto reductase-like oxidoreductase